MNVLFGELTWEEIKQAVEEDYIVILPTGAIEQHGPMLPVDVDDYLARRWAIDAATEAKERYGTKVLVLPHLAYGQSMRHMKFPGTISLSPETYIAVLFEILDNLVEMGFKKLVVINANGGNVPCIDVATRKLKEKAKREGKEVKIYLPTCESVGGEKVRDLYGLISQAQPAFHADAIETSEMLAARPHLVKMDKAVKPTLKVERMPDFVWTTDEITETGASGDPSKATKEIGEKWWAVCKEAFAKFLSEL